jgi:hypothetical protein
MVATFGPARPAGCRFGKPRTLPGLLWAGDWRCTAGCREELHILEQPYGLGACQATAGHHGEMEQDTYAKMTFPPCNIHPEPLRHRFQPLYSLKGH